MRRPSRADSVTALAVLLIALLVGTVGATGVYLRERVGTLDEQAEMRAAQRAELAVDVEKLRSQLLSLGEVPAAGPPESVEPGVSGPEGEPGAAGRPGDPGADGQVSVGPRGPAGVPGGPGAAGDTGGTGGDGQPGEPGEPGEPGADGAGGVAGPSGADGEPGADGADGADGAAGPAGPAGPAGADGPAGPTGADGAPGADGQPAESFTFTDSAGREITCTDPDGDGQFDCEQTGGPGAPGGP